MATAVNITELDFSRISDTISYSSLIWEQRKYRLDRLHNGWTAGLTEYTRTNTATHFLQYLHLPG